jgi:glycosyltransferase involved in cell wall biosynthesis
LPTFSIIIPTFNRAATIKRTLDSVYLQSIDDTEVIVVDDGSTDNTKDILAEYIQLKGLKYYLQSNQGVSAARNYGAANANGEYLIFLDSDDTIKASWLKDYSDKINQQDIDILYCGIERLNGGKIVGNTSPQNPYKNGVPYGNFIPGSFCVKRGLFNRVGGYDIQLSYSENTELSFRLKKEAPKEAFIESFNLEYRISDQGLSKNWMNRKNAMLYILEKHRILLENDSPTRYRFLSIAGVSAVHTNDWMTARLSFKKVCKIHPFSLTCRLRYWISFFPFIAKKIWKQ